MAGNGEIATSQSSGALGEVEILFSCCSSSSLGRTREITAEGVVKGQGAVDCEEMRAKIPIQPVGMRNKSRVNVDMVVASGERGERRRSEHSGQSQMRDLLTN